MISIEPYTLILAALTAVASGLVGSFALMRRMTLAGDAFSHIALPGIGLALLYSMNPVLGGAVALILGALVVWKSEKISRLNTETVIGVLFALSLAVGAIAFNSDHELVEALFGGSASVTNYEFIFGSVVSLLIIWFIFQYRRSLVLMLVSKDLATTSGVRADTLQLLFLVFFALTVMLGMKFLGVLLMGSLIIIPAAVARNVAKSLSGMLAVSSGSSLAAVISGIFLSHYFGASTGPVIIIVAGVFFVGTILFNTVTSR